MKILRKYVNMAFLLVSATTIIPAYANPVIDEQEKIKQEKVIIEPQKTNKKFQEKVERLIWHAKNNKEVIFSITCCALGLSIILADNKYDFYKNYGKLGNLLNGLGATLILFPMFLSEDD